MLSCTRLTPVHPTVWGVKVGDDAVRFISFIPGCGTLFICFCGCVPPNSPLRWVPLLLTAQRQRLVLEELRSVGKDSQSSCKKQDGILNNKVSSWSKLLNTSKFILNFIYKHKIYKTPSCFHYGGWWETVKYFPVTKRAHCVCIKVKPKSPSLDHVSQTPFGLKRHMVVTVHTVNEKLHNLKLFGL